MKSYKKQGIAISLLVLLLIKACIIPLLYLDFELRKDYIVANFCVNRDKPKLHCNGKCYLAKRMAQANKQEERQARKAYMASLIFQVMNTSSADIFPTQAFYTGIRPALTFNYYSVFRAMLVADEIFHPPVA